MDWINGCECTKGCLNTLCERSAMGGFVEIIEVLVDRMGAFCSIRMMVECAAKNGKVNVLKWMFERGYWIDWRKVGLCANNILVLKLAVEHGARNWKELFKKHGGKKAIKTDLYERAAKIEFLMEMEESDIEYALKVVRCGDDALFMEEILNELHVLKGPKREEEKYDLMQACAEGMDQIVAKLIPRAPIGTDWNELGKVATTWRVLELLWVHIRDHDGVFLEQTKIEKFRGWMDMRMKIRIMGGYVSQRVVFERLNQPGFVNRNENNKNHVVRTLIERLIKA